MNQDNYPSKGSPQLNTYQQMGESAGGMLQENWVKARSECTVESSFQLIVKQIRKDIKAFNALQPPPPTCIGGRFIVIDDSKTSIKVLSAHFVHGEGGNFLAPVEENAQDYVTIKIKGDEIYVDRSNLFNTTIKRKWNAETLACDLVVKGKVMLPWNISETILEPFIF